MTEFVRIGRPGQIGSRKNEIYDNYDKLYGKDNWRFVWDVNGTSVDMAGALVLYDDAYFEYFKTHPEDLEWIADNFANVYDNNPSNVNSGFDYTVQEFGGNHFQDIAIRRCLIRNGLWFKGRDLLEIRMNGPGKRFGPSEIPFHMPELIPPPELKGWWNSGSVESWYQSAKYLEVKNPPVFDKDIYFVTRNAGKVNSLRLALGDIFSVGQIKLDIKEELDSVEKIAVHKARVAYSVLCRPVICDDSGFVIPSLDGWPGHKIDRELKAKGEQHFLDLAKDSPRGACFVQVLSYYDERLEKPELFVSKVEGKMIGEKRGNPEKPYLKNKFLAQVFVLDGQEKTLAEMTEEEYKMYASTDRWKNFAEFVKHHS